MRQVNCHIPVKVCVRGRLSDSQLDELGESLIRVIAARMEQAHRTLREHGHAHARETVPATHEMFDPTRLSSGRYGLPSYDKGGETVAVPVAGPAPLHELQYYAFFFTGGDYGRAAEAYIRQFFPEHHRFQARSFEEMFSLLADDIEKRTHTDDRGVRTKRALRRIAIAEIVIVTHANAAGGMKIPLTNDRRGRTFTPWDLADLQDEFRHGLHRRFKQLRREVLAALSERTSIIVRGCEFGQSQEALDALRIFFGGQPYVWAPKGYQGFEVLPVGKSILRTQEEAFDFLVNQGYLPEDQLLIPVEEKKKYIRSVFGASAAIPAEFFIMGKEEHDELGRLAKQRLALTGAAERLLRRPFEEGEAERLVGVNVPSLGEYWGLSALPSLGYDPELDSLSIEEIEARARKLHDDYRPQYAAMLLRLAKAWTRKTLERRPMVATAGEVLGGLPPFEIFGDANLLAGDAARFPGPPPPETDLFEIETLPRRTATVEERRSAQEFREAEAYELIATSGLPPSEEATVSRDGRVDPLPDGVRLWDFGVNSASLRPAFKRALQEVAQKASHDSDLRIRLEGHASSSGTKRDNEQLSQTRADTVREEMIRSGISADRINAVGLGASAPVAQERVRGRLVLENVARNRCVDVVFVRLSGAPTPSPTGKPAPTLPAGIPSAKSPEPWLTAPEFGLDWETPSIPLGKFDVGAIIISVKLKGKLKGSVQYGSPTTKITFTHGQARADFEKKFQSSLGQMKLKGRVEPGKFSQIALGVGATDWLELEFAANTDLTKVFQITAKIPVAEGKFRFEDWIFKGKFEAALEINFGPNPKWIAEVAATSGGGQVVVRWLADAATFVRGLFVVEELGTVTLVGAVAIGVGVGAVAAAVVLGGLYVAGRAAEKGWALAAGFAFGSGYADMFALLTDGQPVRGHLGDPTPILLNSFRDLLGLDWPRQLEEDRDAYVEARRNDNDQKARNLSSKLYKLGRAAAFQNWQNFMSLYSWEEWKRFARAHREKFGESMQQRANRYDLVLKQQIKDEAEELGIPVFPVPD
jgi:outer membrane protein OmpA-like peptidoglycan-associated protein